MATVLFQNSTLKVTLNTAGTHVDIWTPNDAETLTIGQFEVMVDNFLDVKMTSIK